MISEVKVRCLQGLLTAEGYPATGTSTDTITVAFLPGPKQPYAGAVTPTGKALGLAVDQAFRKSLVKMGLNPCEPASSLVH